MTNNGYARMAIANTINCEIGAPIHNAEVIARIIKEVASKGAKIVVFPELTLTGYTCQDLFFNNQLLNNVKIAINNLIKTMPNGILAVVGAPLCIDDVLYNCAIVIEDSNIVGIVPKQYIPNYNEFYEKRWFSYDADVMPTEIPRASIQTGIFSKEDYIPFGNIIFKTSIGVNLGIEICEDLWSVVPPSSYLALAGANVIANLSASNELVGKNAYRQELIKTQSARTISAYLYTSANFSESTSDLVFSGSGYAYENGKLIESFSRYNTEEEYKIFDIDFEALVNERMVNKTFADSKKNIKNMNFTIVNSNIDSDYENENTSTLLRKVNPNPFVPSKDNIEAYNTVCNEIIDIQATGLLQRLKAIHCSKAVIGISGGLDSTLALLVTIEAFDRLNLPHDNIITVTMPGFGTTGRTYQNAVNFCNGLGTTLREISIKDACIQHFKDIEHDENVHDITYENVQARERTQILMDIANKEGGIVIGTGDLSELMLGWCTYNGDHMSMYGVNCSIPKTLVRTLTAWYTDNMLCKPESPMMYEKLKSVLHDIIDTPISPELLPTDGKKVVQKTEDNVGPYEVNDFFIYHFFRNRFSKEKILRIANVAFEGKYSAEKLSEYYEQFIKRVMTNQFKRNCAPDGPMVGSVSASPRGFLRMPSDMSWLNW